MEKGSSKNALGKARNDIYNLLVRFGCKESLLTHSICDRKNANLFQKVYTHITEAYKWNSQLELFQTGDIVVIQYPLVNHTLFFSHIVRGWKRKGIKTIAFIHDLELIRHAASNKFPMKKRIRVWVEEISVIKQFDHIIVHNEQMKEYLCKRHHINENRVCCLEIFDYLTDDEMLSNGNTNNTRSEIIVAGNLDPNKAGYVYQLPDEPLFNLYGINYEMQSQSNLIYKGAYEADKIIKELKGDYGLIWDGGSSETCSGVYGNYLRYNNPHKTSLYLAAGIPVIIWENAAMAAFIKEQHCGITIKSLNDISSALAAVNTTTYRQIKSNAMTIGNRLRDGYYTKKALNSILKD